MSEILNKQNVALALSLFAGASVLNACGSSTQGGVKPNLSHPLASVSCKGESGHHIERFRRLNDGRIYVGESVEVGSVDLTSVGDGQVIVKPSESGPKVTFMNEYEFSTHDTVPHSTETIGRGPHEIAIRDDGSRYLAVVNAVDGSADSLVVLKDCK
ncbi:MAG TPA: hypothetical protein VL989_02040 [Candidatus Sulfotelmatobacter sp.]|nr:hypothetical protein [Candidatus Sulfotelmatobacter sp.]